MRPKLEMVPQAARTAQGAGGNGLGRTKGYSTTLGTAACHCGPGRDASPRYICLTCAGFARIAQRIEARATHLRQEPRRWRT